MPTEPTKKSTRKGNAVTHAAALLIGAAAVFIVIQFIKIATGNVDLSPPVFPQKENLKSLGVLDYERYSLTDVRGKEISLARFKGRVLLLGFWATWCGPCKYEMPSVDRLYQVLKTNKDVAVVMVAEEDPAVIRRYMEEMKLSFPVYLNDGSLSRDLHISGIPTNLIVNPQGEVVFRHTGAAQWDHPSCAAFLQGLTAQKRP